MNKKSEAKDPLVIQIKQRIMEIDEQINALKNQHFAARQMLAALNGERIEPQEKDNRKNKSSDSKTSLIFDTLSNLAQKHQRPVTIEEILQELSQVGAVIGKTEARRRSYLGAVFSAELKKENSRIIRSERGTYDIKK